jgi:tRNA splicing ligase
MFGQNYIIKIKFNLPVKMIRALFKTWQNTTKKPTESRSQPFTKWNKMGLIDSKKRWPYIHCSMAQERKKA